MGIAILLGVADRPEEARPMAPTEASEDRGAEDRGSERGPTVLDRIERSAVLDRVAEGVAPAAARLMGDPRLRDALTGRWLGHPLHPALVLVPTSCWMGATLLDVVGGRSARPAARKLTALGVVSAVPAAASGVADWLDTAGAERRVGLVHAVGNLAACGLYALSWSRRRDGRTGSATVASIAGAALVGATGFLGGHLAYRRGVGVNTTAFGSGPSDWTVLPGAAEVPAGTVRAARLDDTALAVVGRGGRRPAVLEDRCTHRGGPLHDGDVEDGCLRCPWHGSRFDVETGAVRAGPASVPQPVYDTRTRGEQIEIRRDEPGGLRRNPVGPGDLDGEALVDPSGSPTTATTTTGTRTT